MKGTAARFGVPPQLPDPNPPEGSNFLLTRTWVRKDEAYKIASGHLLFVYTFCYEYDILNLDDVTLPDPIPPFVLPQVKAQFPGGLPQATIAADIVW